MDILKHPDLQKKTLLAYARGVPPEEAVGKGALLGDMLLPDSPPKFTLTIDMVKGAHQQTVMAFPTELDGEPPPLGRRGIKAEEVDLPPLKISRMMDRKTRLLYLMNQKNATDINTAELVKAIYDDVDFVIRGFWSRVEWMKIRALVMGELTVQDDADDPRVRYTFDYGRPVAHEATLSGDDRWDIDTDSDGFYDANFLLQFETWMRAFEDSGESDGVELPRLLTSKTQVRNLLNNKHARQLVWGLNWNDYSRPLTVADLNTQLANRGLPRIANYDKKAYIENIYTGARSLERFFPEDYVLLLPDASVELGTGEYGSPVEALEDADLTLQEAPGLFVTVDKAEGTVVTKSSGLMLPSIPGIHNTFLARVTS